MLNKYREYTVGEIIEKIGLPFFIKNPKDTYDFFWKRQSYVRME